MPKADASSSSSDAPDPTPAHEAPAPMPTNPTAAQASAAEAQRAAFDARVAALTEAFAELRDAKAAFYARGASPNSDMADNAWRKACAEVEERERSRGDDASAFVLAAVRAVMFERGS